MSENVKEVKEALVGINEVAILLIKNLKDGAQISDAAAIIAQLMADEALKAKLSAAVAGCSAIPAELGDLDLAEGLELGMVQLSYIPKILEALK